MCVSNFLIKIKSAFGVRTRMKKGIQKFTRNYPKEGK